MMPIVMRLLLAAASLLWAAAAAAHSMPSSVVNIDIGRYAVRVETVLPANELRLAFSERLQDRDNRLTTELRRDLDGYLERHIAVSSSDGVLLKRTASTLWIEPGEGRDNLVVRMTFAVAPGSNSPTFILHDDAITHVVMSHVIAVFRRGDDGGRSLDAEPELLGLLQNPAADIRFTRTSGKAGHRFAEAFRIGMWHIAEGADHLLFLFTLLLPAPFLAAVGRWSVARSRWNTIRHLAAVVTAFTIGHSITLMAGVLFDWQLPWPLVEVVIALSVFVAAIQAWRPIFGSREPLLALAFGLFHGMAFSTVIGRQLIDPWLKFEAVLAFNVGVETVQLGLVAISAPLLLFLASRDWYHRVRSLAALASGLVAAIWVVERLVGMNVVAAPAGMTGLVGYLVVPAAAAGALMLAMRLGRGGGGLEAKHAASGRQ